MKLNPLQFEIDRLKRLVMKCWSFEDDIGHLDLAERVKISGKIYEKKLAEASCKQCLDFGVYMIFQEGQQLDVENLEEMITPIVCTCAARISVLH